MSLVRVPVCARPGCGQLASTSARPSGSSAAYVPVCSQRCGYELIGPKRGATDDDADERAAAHQQLLVRRQHDKKRFGDLVKMSDIMAKLGRLRARLPEMTELEVATATLAIGRRLAEDGSDIERRIDAALTDAHVVVDHILKDEPYDMQTIAARMDALRRDIAADVALDAFDATDVGRAAKAAGVPDDARQLAAYKVNPIQKLAAFSADAHDNGYLSFAEIRQINIIAVAGQYYRKNGEVANLDGVVRPSIHNDTDNQIAAMRHRAYLDGDPTHGWYVDWPNSNESVTKIWGKLRDKYDMLRVVRIGISEVFVASGQHAGVFKLAPDYASVTYTPIAGPLGLVSDVTHSIAITAWSLRYSDSKHLHLRVTIDRRGRVWLVDGAGMHVFSTSGQYLASLPDPGLYAVTSSADGGVWALVTDQSTGRSTCGYYQLVPDAEYSRGL